MPALIGLPLEILENIAGFTIPEGFESYALTCQKLHTACNRLISKYNLTKREWRTFSANCLEETSGSLYLLELLFKDPIRGKFVQHANLRPSETTIYFADFGLYQAEWDHEPEPEEREVPEEMAGAIKKLVYENATVAAAGVDKEAIVEELISELEDPSQGDLLLPAFLLTLMPNLRELALPESYLDRYICFDEPQAQRRAEHVAALIKVMVEDVLRGIPNAPLSKIETILPATGPQWAVRLSLEALAPLLALPSLKYAYIASCVMSGDRHTKKLYPFLSYPLSPNLETLELFACALSSSAMATLMQSTQRLRTLKYYHEHKAEYDWGNRRWSAGSFVDAILYSLAADSLEHLVLDVVGERDRMMTGVVSLQRLRNLKTLEISLDYLDGPPVPEGYLEVEIDEFDMEFGQAQVPMLHNFIPTRLEQLSLFGDLDVGYANHSRQNDRHNGEIVRQLCRDFDMAHFIGYRLEHIIAQFGRKHDVDDIGLDEVLTSEEWLDVRKAFTLLGGEIFTGFSNCAWVTTFCKKHKISQNHHR